MGDEAKIAAALSTLTATIEAMKANSERGDREFQDFRDLVHEEYKLINTKLAAMNEKVTFIKACGTVAKWVIGIVIAGAGVTIAARSGTR